MQEMYTPLQHMFWPAVIVYVRFFFTKGWRRLYGPWISPPFAKRHAVRVVLVFASSGICPYVLHPLRNLVDPVRLRPCIRSQGFKRATCEHSSPISYESFGEPAPSSEWQGICTCSSSIRLSLLHSQDPPAIRHVHETTSFGCAEVCCGTNVHGIGVLKISRRIQVTDQLRMYWSVLGNECAKKFHTFTLWN